MTRFLIANVLLITLLLFFAPFSPAQDWKTQMPKKQVDPLVKSQRKAERIENSLPVLDTSCEQVICTNSPHYPAAAMAKVVDESREILKSGSPSVLFENRRMDLKSFDSKILDSEVPLSTHGRCTGHRKLTYPLEGYNRHHEQFFYVVNIPGFRQGVCTKVCSSNADRYQAYSEEKLVVLPIGQRHFTIQDLKIRKILIPHDCPKKVF
ncbi:uncharacterized protein LOC131666583 [Phymastichus coffea]|uniref:uncharacterized protein LOC131666583 n=1 Tax=Phymastichus coffea TaxID=108790 RepID=UPI00273CE906|nr:uncharacterized protein LOC131666583 [Phymastichus coffea]